VGGSGKHEINYCYHERVPTTKNQNPLSQNERLAEKNKNKRST